MYAVFSPQRCAPYSFDSGPHTLNPSPLTEAKERTEEDPKPPKQKITDPDELHEYRTRKRKEFEDGNLPTLFFVALVTVPRSSLSLQLSDTRVYEPQIRARLVTTAHFCEVVVLALRAVPV